jgi:hypothetical protein
MYQLWELVTLLYRDLETSILCVRKVKTRPVGASKTNELIPGHGGGKQRATETAFLRHVRNFRHAVLYTVVHTHSEGDSYVYMLL